MSLAIAVATYRAGPATEATWDDLRVCLSAVKAYARGIETVVAWDGPCPPDDLPDNPMCRVLARPPGMHSGTAYRWAIEQTQADDVVVLSDDVVLQPDTIDKLVQDADFLRKAGHRLGFLGCRSNNTAGPQNIRSLNGGTWTAQINGYTSELSILPVDRIYPACALVSRAASDACAASDLDRASDDIACFDMLRAGYTHYVSRAYAHHVGMRSSGADRKTLERLSEEAIAWIHTYRPDFWQYWVAEGLIQDNGGAASSGQRVATAPTDRVGEPALSVVLAVTDGVKGTIRALQSVAATCNDIGEVQVVVIDNGSTDGTQAALEQLVASTAAARVARQPQTVPARSAWLEGAAMATGRLVLFLSNDVVLTPGFLSPLLMALGAGRGGVTPVLRSAGADRTSSDHDTQSGLCMLLARADLASGQPLRASVVSTSVVDFHPSAPEVAWS